MNKKVYVDVIAEFRKQELIKPLVIKWSDGRKYKVDRIVKCTSAGRIAKDAYGLLYIFMVEGKEVSLYYEEGRYGISWFVLGKGA
ncbi:hypothetical protein [Butyrivibrio sp. AC2005]|uniref:hypothetical protein n=1 Tax=Butyrivibrio sp. AC2005 TaxID=1280672 RepID=UPI00047CD14E|nr:hypothetical protein [Butyrivibrio sp. AC2005]